jgi:hypothetical protein
MRPFALGGSVVLLISCLVSAAVAFITLPRNVKLESGNDYEPLAGAEQPTDPFDIVKPEDLIDGYAISPERFWERMRIIKAILCAILIFVVGVQAVQLGYVISSNLEDRDALLASGVLQLIAYIYILVFAVMSVAQDDVERHWSSIIHISAITSVAVFFLSLSAVMPSRSVLPTVVLTSNSSVMSIFYGISLALLLVACIIAINTPRGPPLHFPASRLYSPKLLESSAPLAHNNVCGVVQASVWDFLLFSYTTAIVKLGHTAESLEIRDLPIIPASARAAALFSAMRAANFADATRQEKLRQRRRTEGRGGAKRTRRWWWQKEGSGWPLLFRLARINASGFIVLMTLAAVTAVLYYVPAWFLQSLIQYLQDHPDREQKSWGWLWVKVYLPGFMV